ncbi:hypothetical protein OSB04_un001320 [Centaurea solstitialis]|uniref:RNase H type-1 domain-containing protein n=1 Tax=Centaurea solstitialis TaxID=347529 RepID=A0AA38SG31_9ASTR|nr:hypothetical protein OSB04_un001320 [Centaurea solstitialis]
MSSSSIINKVKHWCKDLLQLDYPTHSSGFHDSICFQVMHIPMVSPNIPKGKWIKWAPPPFGIFKLNTDGSSRNGMAAGGGIIRDYKGSALVAFSTFYGPVPWTVPYMIRSFKTFLLPSMSISHIYREGNQSADTLATHGSIRNILNLFLMALFLLPLLPKELVEQSWRTNTNSKQSLGSLSLGGCSTRLTKLSIDTNNKRTSFPERFRSPSRPFIWNGDLSIERRRTDQRERGPTHYKGIHHKIELHSCLSRIKLTARLELRNMLTKTSELRVNVRSSKDGASPISRSRSGAKTNTPATYCTGPSTRHSTFVESEPIPLHCARTVERPPALPCTDIDSFFVPGPASQPFAGWPAFFECLSASFSYRSFNILDFSIRGALARPFSCRSASARPYVFFACSAVRASYKAAPNMI